MKTASLFIAIVIAALALGGCADTVMSYLQKADQQTVDTMNEYLTGDLTDEERKQLEEYQKRQLQ